MRAQTRRRRAVVAAASAAALAVTAACGSNGDSGDNGGDDGEVTLSIHVFGGAGFGYDELIEQFNDEHENITVDHQVTTDDYDGEYRPTLVQQLDAGNAPDVAAVEEQGVGQMMAMNDAWVDLAEHGLDERESDYTDWKWELGHTNDGKLAGLGTDVGGLALCYRTDLFEEAGLPTDRQEIGERWADWNGFMEVAQEFTDAGLEAEFLDNPTQIYNTRLIQESGANNDGISYFDREGNFVASESPSVQTAFDMVMDLYDMEALGPFETWTDEWNAAMGAGGYAVSACPAWMTGVIEDTAGEENAGNWDVAQVPGGAGNWGGSWLGVTSNSEHPEEAAELVDFLTSPDGQVAAFEAVGNFPSSPVAQEDPAVADITNDYFNGAPTGEIYSESIKGFEPVYFGELHSATRGEMESVLTGLVQDTHSPDEAWDLFIQAGEEAVQLQG